MVRLVKHVFFVLTVSTLFSLDGSFLSNKAARVYVAGHTGMVGSAIVRKLKKLEFNNIVTRQSCDLDLRNQASVEKFFSEEKPDYVFLAAAKVGGIGFNMTHPAEFIYDNLLISANVIHASYKFKVKKLIFLGSSCVYPCCSLQPIKEEYLLTGIPEPTNEAYSIAKIAGLMMCRKYKEQYGANFIACMPSNLYGQGDNFNLAHSHVIPALVRRFCEAVKNSIPNVLVWGTGNAFREFLHVDDCADATIFLMEHYDGKEIINVGAGSDIQIKDLCLTIKDIIKYKGSIDFDASKPDGMRRKLLNVEKLFSLGWRPQVSLKDGLTSVIKFYRSLDEGYKRM